MTWYAVKGRELQLRANRFHVRLGDSNNVETVANRLPAGRKKDPFYGPWGCYYHPITSGADPSTMGFQVPNGPSPATVTEFAPGAAPPAPLAALINLNATGASVGVYTGAPVFAPAWRNYLRNSFFAVDPFTNQSVKFGELSVKTGSNGGTYYGIASGCAGTTIYTSAPGAINDTTGVAGDISFYETPATATGTGSSDISFYRQTLNGTPASGKALYPLYRGYRHATLDKTRYGEISLGFSGAAMTHYESGSSGPSGIFFKDALLDAIFLNMPIEGDYATGGISGVVHVMLTQNGYTTKGAFMASCLAVIGRIRDSLDRVGKGDKDILICFELSWDSTLNIEDYNPLTEQVRFNEMWEVISQIAAASTALHDKVAALPTGLEIRARYGVLTNWAHTGVAWLAQETGTPANKTAAIHPSNAGSLNIPLVATSIIARGDKPSGAARASRGARFRSRSRPI